MYVEQKYYDTLKVKRSDNFEDIQNKYMELAVKYRKQNKMEEFDKLNVAWSLVSQYHEEDINRVKKEDDNSKFEKKKTTVVNHENKNKEINNSEKTNDVKNKLRTPVKEISTNPNKTLKCPNCKEMNYPSASFCSNCFFSFKSGDGLKSNTSIFESIFSALIWIFEKLFMYDDRLSISRIICFLIVCVPALLCLGSIGHLSLWVIFISFIIFAPIYIILRIIELLYHYFS